MFRAVLRKTPLPMDSDKIEADIQTFHPSQESARDWARKVIANGVKVEIYQRAEDLVETITG